uniref:13S globulin seed storage protein 2-like n=1 Tax=Erigeron canadensis TaxID=72917 RepID=UPI001CB97D2A|nr:13S globulin seed storage protein 2-like [Erigeron canadensis]
METKMVVEKADQTAFEGDSGGYYVWSSSKSPLLSDFKLGAGKLLLRPLGFALPHYADSSKIGFVIKGTCTVGLVAPNSPEEKVLLIKEGDAIPLSSGVISWWFNSGDTDVVIVFLGETNKALVPGQFTYYFVSGVLGILAGFGSDIVGKTFDLDPKESENVVSSQPGALLVKLKSGIKFPEPSKHTKEKLFATLNEPLCHTSYIDGGSVNSLTGNNFPMLGTIGLSARFVKLIYNSMLAPSYVADGSVQMNYVVKGSGKIRVVGSEGKPILDSKVEEGDLFIVPQFFPSAYTADDCGMEVFSIITSSKPIFGQLAGNTSIWKALAPIVLQSTLNINQKLEHLKWKNTVSIIIVPGSKLIDENA